MGASSVTGVGQGSADKAGQKGSEHLYVGVEKLIGTRVVLSGIVKIATGTTVTVNLPQNLPGVWSGVFDETETNPADTIPPAISDYIVMVHAYGNATATYVSSMAVTSGVQNFTITGQNAAYVFYTVVRHSYASVTGFPTHN